MIHPDTELCKVNDLIGYGVFASRDIPAGTIVYVKDALEIVITPEQYIALETPYKRVADRYSYIDNQGSYIISWDIAKYVNHCCTPNTISTGYGFEIAVRDIARGEEITDEYGMFNLTEPMQCFCGSSQCRKFVSPDDWKQCASNWNRIAKAALAKIKDVDQPLYDLIDEETKSSLAVYLASFQPYRDIRGLIYNGRYLYSQRSGGAFLASC